MPFETVAIEPLLVDQVPFGVELLNVVVAPTQTEVVPVFAFTVGKAFTVTVTVLVQPFVFLYVIIDVPCATPVTTPLVVIVATLVATEVHGEVAFGVAEPVNVVVFPTQTDNVPVMVGNAFTVTVTVLVQPFVFLYVIIDVPCATPVTTPLIVIVATPVVAEVHGVVAFGVAEPVSVVVAPTQTDNVPVIVGNAFTVTVVATAFVQPFSVTE